LNIKTDPDRGRGKSERFAADHLNIPHHHAETTGEKTSTTQASPRFLLNICLETEVSLPLKKTSRKIDSASESKKKQRDEIMLNLGGRHSEKKNRRSP
jgi:hypothetical protein